MPRVESKRPWPAASVGFTKRGLGPEGDVHHHPVIAMEPDRYHPLKLALSRWFRQIGDVTIDPTKRRQACKTSIPSEDRAVRRCRARQVKPSMADCCRSVSVAGDFGGAFH
jgi:hypothetical protein